MDKIIKRTGAEYEVTPDFIRGFILSRIEPIKCRGTYGLKHIIERQYILDNNKHGYCSEDWLKEELNNLGYEFRNGRFYKKTK